MTIVWVIKYLSLINNTKCLNYYRVGDKLFRIVITNVYDMILISIYVTRDKTVLTLKLILLYTSFVNIWSKSIQIKE